MSTKDIYNFKTINEKVATGGQPSEEQLRSADDEGFNTVINLATLDPRYSLKDEEELVRSLGMNYFHIPVAWENPQKSDFEAFEQTLKTAENNKTLIHCAANYRVTAFFSLYAMKYLGWSEGQADELMAHVWKQGQYPIWDEFIQKMRAEMLSASPG